ncbi:hypothetical protein F6X40_27960, partial [Paraburkholderia sp. UCT31]|uniref:hypothetical protein n=1 Tax=Paraburkholderia sp. UCT31 TaxID=2615209 RepID=UPI001CA389A1
MQKPIALLRARKLALAVALLGLPLLAFSYTFRVPVSGLTSTTASVVTPIGTLNFTTCGTTGRTGPTLAACQAAYISQPNIMASLAMRGYQGYQEWTVPATGSYTITAAGAGGGSASIYGYSGGGGAIMRGTVGLQQGDVLQIVVGQPGIAAQALYGVYQTDGGGGGGSFVVLKAGSVPLVVAGGGGGSNYVGASLAYGNGGAGVTTTTGGVSPPGKSENTQAGTGGINGNGATTGYGEPGAGFLSNGGLPVPSSNFTVALGFNAGSVGGTSTNATPNRYGGFGGGAGAHGLNCIGGGAGGG